MKCLVSFAALFAACAHAQESKPTRPVLPLWEVGVVAAGVSQQAYPGSDQQAGRVLALPYVVYRGKVFRADDRGAGLRAVTTDDFELDVSFAGSLSSGSETLRAREGMARLPTLLEAGPVGRWYLNGRASRERVTLELPLRGVFEARNPSHHRGMSFEPKLSLQRRGEGDWSYGGSIAAVVGDRRLGATFYDVAPSEARPERPAFSARAGLIAWRLNANVGTSLTPDMRVYAFSRFESLAGAANRGSPLVRQTNGASFGVGLTYTLMRSTAGAND
ncbi:MAG: MipA/OmpV family protein [Rubrivivax sp.]|nr:MAG: MipA/OmpV family protein [Rubrivivax sp.]